MFHNEMLNNLFLIILINLWYDKIYLSERLVPVTKSYYKLQTV